jgi:SAM-dependent methyltransferase
MTPFGYLHNRLIFGRRVERLSAALAEALAPDATLLDVGCGDGSIAAAVQRRRPDVTVTGVDVLVRPDTKIPVTAYDGETLPFADRSFDAVCFIDVLHHTDDPERVLAEAARVARHVVLVKDHLADQPLAHPTLRLMDWFGNARHSVRLPYNYLTAGQWRAVFGRLDLHTRSWDEHLGLYPMPLSLAFDRRLHVFFTVTPAEPGERPDTEPVRSSSIANAADRAPDPRRAG